MRPRGHVGKDFEQGTPTGKPGQLAERVHQAPGIGLLLCARVGEEGHSSLEVKIGRNLEQSELDRDARRLLIGDEPFTCGAYSLDLDAWKSRGRSGRIDDEVDGRRAATARTVASQAVQAERRVTVEGRRPVVENRRPLSLLLSERTCVIDIDAWVDHGPLSTSDSAPDVSGPTVVEEYLPSTDHALLGCHQRSDGGLVELAGRTRWSRHPGRMRTPATPHTCAAQPVEDGPCGNAVSG